MVNFITRFFLKPRTKFQRNDSINQHSRTHPLQLVLFSPTCLTYKRARSGNTLAYPQNKTGRQDRIEDGMTKQPHETDVAFIQALAELLNKNDLTELTVKREYGENDSLNVRVSKQTNIVTTVAAAPPQMMQAAAPIMGAAPAAAADADPANHPGAVTSPMVGTTYLSAEPGAEPFVTVGSTVTEGQTVVIIEAMKTMNQIPAPHAGIVKRILITDGSPVEYGAPLMIIE